MSTLYVCKSCLNEQEFYNAVMATPANEYKSVSSCFDCRTGLDEYTINEIEVLTLLDSQESYSNRVEQEGRLRCYHPRANYRHTGVRS